MSAVVLTPAACRIYVDELRKAHPDERDYLNALAHLAKELEDAELALADKLPELERARLRKQIFGSK